MNTSTSKNKTKRVALLLLLALLSASVARAQETIIVTIGDTIVDEFSDASYLIPFSMQYDYSLSQQIYLADEIGTAGFITAISFNYCYFVDMYHGNTLYYDSLFCYEGVQVYMKLTEKYKFDRDTDIVPLSESDKVWEGTFTATGAGWVTITLDTPFAYDGASNLLVCCFDPVDGYLNKSWFSFHCTSMNNYMTFVDRVSGNGLTPSIDHIVDYSSRLHGRNDIRLHILSEPIPNNLAVSELTDQSATITWEAPQTSYNITGYTYLYKKATDEQWSAEVITTGTSVALSGLAGGTEYRFRIKVLFSDHEGFYTFIDFTTLAIPLPNMTVSDITGESATFSWEPPETSYTVTGYAYQYKRSYDTDWSAETTTSGTSATVVGLMGLTEYQFRAKALFTDHESSWTSISFTTLMQLPYEYGFENGMNGWILVNKDTNYTGITTNQHLGGQHSFHFFDGGERKIQYLISPEALGTEAMTVSFYYYTYTGCLPTVRVGYSTTTNDTVNFTWVERITPVTFSWNRFEHTFPVGTKYVAISVSVPDPYVYNGQYYYAYALNVDDFCFMADSPYPQPTVLTVSNLIDQSATLSWMAPETSLTVTGYAYQYQLANDLEWSNLATVNATSVTLSGLSPNSTYHFRVKALYAGGLASNYVSTSFMTEGVIESLPHYQDFENGMGGWRKESYHWSKIEYIDGSQCFRFYNCDHPQYLFSPQFDCSSRVSVSFRYRNYTDGTYSFHAFFQVGYSTTTKDLDAFTWGNTITTTHQWQQYTDVFPVGTKYIAIKWLEEGYYLYLDDFIIDGFFIDAGHPFTENFTNSAAFPPQYWENPSVVVDGVNRQWAWNYFFYHNDSGSANSGRYGTTYLKLPELYISDDVNIAQLAFWSLYTIPPYAKCSVVLLDGDNETELWTPDAELLQNEVWYETRIDLSAYIGQTINLAFKHEGNGTSTWSIDNVEVSVPWSGEGTEQDPFIITDAWQLEALAHLVNNGTDYNGKFFRLDADLNYNLNLQNNHKPIGNGPHRFLGTFDGNGHTISGIRINGSDSYLGIFGGCYGSMVKNLTLTNAQISGDSRVGGIVGDNYLGTVENCHVTNSTLSGSGQYIGGIVGWNDRGTLSSNTVFFATVSAGGGTILGTNQNGTLNHNYYSGCTVGEVTNATNVGTSNGDVNENNGAVFAIAVFPWMEDFISYNNNTIPAGWDNSASTSSTLGTNPERLWGVYRYNNGNQMLRMFNYYVRAGTALINSPKIVLPPEEEWELVFDYSHTASCGPFTVKISTDYGTTFVDLASFGKVGESTSYTDPGEFTRVFIPLTEYAGQTVMIQFYAEADFGTGAIFVDNIKIDVAPTCYIPYGLAADNITTNSARLSWKTMEEMESYTLKYKATESVVFSDGFENGIALWTLRDCHQNTGITDFSVHSDQNAFEFQFTYLTPQYLISPMLSGVTEGVRLKFYYRNYSSDYPETFQIGFSSTDNSTESFTFGDETTVADGQWHLFSEPIPAGTKYICWKYTSNKLFLYIDDITVGAEIPDSEWQTVTSNTTDVTLSDLTPTTLYEVQVKSNCYEAEWSEPMNFMTFGHFTVSGDGYYIYSATGWDLFCDALQDNDTYNRFIGKTVKLGADITVTRMAGSSYHDFMGTFDGQGHTLTLAYGSAESPFSEEYAAPFRYVENGANIHSLHVDGHIYTSNKYASGIVGCQYGTVSVSNCRSSVVIHSSINGDGTHGGIMAVHHNTLTVSGCVFDGRLLTTNGTTLCSGLIGYHYGTLTLSDCLYAPAEVTLATGETYINNGATFCRHYDDSPDNCYYTKVMGSAQGKLAHSITSEEGITVENAGTATAYDVSGITGYGTGIEYDDVLYAGYGDEVSLNLSVAYDFNNNEIFDVSAGTLNGTSNPYTLIMPDQNVSITIPCPTPFNIATDNIMTTTAVLSWNILTDMESYTVRYKGFAFKEGFENGLGDWTLRDCHEQTGTSNIFAHSGERAFYFRHSTTPPQYLISPMLTGIGEGMRLEFYYRNNISSFETFQIGFSSTDDATASFVFGDIITASDMQWHLYSEPIPAGTKYICWKYTSYDQYRLYIDDIGIFDDISNNGWQTLSVNGNGTQVSTTLTSLTPNTLYEAQVKSNCDEALWSEIISFTTNNIDIIGDTIIIYNTSGWDFLCDALQDNDTYNRFIGKTVKLGADISVTRMAGSSTHDFMGTFDGQGHTLTIAYGTAENPITEEYAAPFRNVENGCVIENLHVDGTITTANKFAAGIVAQQYGAVTIRNCRSSVTIQSSVEGDGTHGGLVGVKGNSNYANLTIEGCTFDGKIVSTSTTATTLCGGFVGWRSNSGLLTITNSLYAPTADNNAVSSGATFARNWTMPDDANCYYTETMGAAQGKLAIANPAVSPIGEATATYDVSDLAFYSNGVLFGEVFYYDPEAVATQTIALAGGVNWVSFNVEITLQNLQDALVASLPSGTQMTISSQSNGNTTYNGSRWRGQLSAIDVTQMYMINVNANCEIVLEGRPINPVMHPVTLHTGLNWIAFPLSESMTLNTAFAGFALNGDIVSSQSNGSATYTNQWRGQLSILEPGKGYMYKSNVQGDRTFVFPIIAK